MSKLLISVSKLKTAATCSRQYYYLYESDVPKGTDYPRLCGIAAHRHVQQLYEEPADPRPFFFQTKAKAIGAWSFRWRRAVEQAVDEKKLEFREEFFKRYFKIGLICIARYWDANLARPRPLAIEKRLETPLMTGVGLIGILDQIRSVNLDFIQRHRPELLNGETLNPGYDPVVIVDLKTGSDRYTYSRGLLRAKPNTMDLVRRQFELHEDLQATMYTFLYEKITGKKPVGVIRYHLRSGQWFFSFRTEQDYQTLYGVIWHFLDNVQAQSFPKNIGPHCERCDFLSPCRENRGFLLVKPEDAAEAIEDSSIPLVVPTGVEKSPFTQKRMKFRAPRVKRAKPEIVPSPAQDQKLVLHSLPWDSLPPKEELKLREQAPNDTAAEPPMSV